MLYYSAHYLSPLGAMTMVSDGINLVGLWFDTQKYFLGSLPEKPLEQKNIPVFTATRHWLDRYFAGEKPQSAELPLAPIGGDFRQAVWRILCKIPYGETTTYGKIANKIAAQTGKKSMSSQAVGGAVGHNPISIIIPCHRVVGTNGSLTGYAGGIARKKQLLIMEGVDMTKLFDPQKGTAL
ncbi:MAG: methylated-DNA--[Lachnospiraceae bacterium]|nr:methylated-DNA--[protein]-cysteine S-methyltransferase [Lachnospiraceae bacterium]